MARRFLYDEDANDNNNEEDDELILDPHHADIVQRMPDPSFHLDNYISDVFPPRIMPLEEDHPITQIDFNLYGDLIEKYEKSLAMQLYEEENCVVTLNEIKYGDYFYKCSQCAKPFDYYVFKRWINTNKSCSHCRYKYDNYPQVYIKRRSLAYMIKYHTYNGYMLLRMALQHVILRWQSH